MRKILWCGGSHLGSSKDVIPSIFEHDENTFHVTAGGKNRLWSMNGGTYRVEGTVVGGNAHEPERREDLSRYDHIVFVGQYIQPNRYFQGDCLLSNAVISKILSQDDFLIKFPDGIYNQPLELFPDLHPRVTLLADPWHSKQHIDRKCLSAFVDAVSQFCIKRNIRLMFQPASTLSERYQTDKKFKKSDIDRIHCNAAFWNEYLSCVFNGIDS